MAGRTTEDYLQALYDRTAANDQYLDSVIAPDDGGTYDSFGDGGFLDSAINGALNGLGSSLGSIGTYMNQEFGFGQGLEDFGDAISQGRQARRQFTRNDSLFDFITDPNGLTYTAFNLVGSSAPDMAATALVGAATGGVGGAVVGSGLKAAKAARLAKTASALEKAIAVGTDASELSTGARIARAAFHTAPEIAGNVAGGYLDAASEAGDTYNQAIQNGATQEEARNAMDTDFMDNIGMSIASNAVEMGMFKGAANAPKRLLGRATESTEQEAGKGLLGSLSDFGGKVADFADKNYATRVLTHSVPGMAVESYTEGLQNEFQNSAITGENVNYNPLEMGDESKDQMFMAGMGMIPMGLLGGIGHRRARRVDTTGDEKVVPSPIDDAVHAQEGTPNVEESIQDEAPVTENIQIDETELTQQDLDAIPMSSQETTATQQVDTSLVQAGPKDFTQQLVDKMNNPTEYDLAEQEAYGKSDDQYSANQAIANLIDNGEASVLGYNPVHGTSMMTGSERDDLVKAMIESPNIPIISDSKSAQPVAAILQQRNNDRYRQATAQALIQKKNELGLPISQQELDNANSISPNTGFFPAQRKEIHVQEVDNRKADKEQHTKNVATAVNAIQEDIKQNGTNSDFYKPKGGDISDAGKARLNKLGVTPDDAGISKALRASSAAATRSYETQKKGKQKATEQAIKDDFAKNGVRSKYYTSDGKFDSLPNEVKQEITKGAGGEITPKIRNQIKALSGKARAENRVKTQTIVSKKNHMDTVQRINSSRENRGVTLDTKKMEGLSIKEQRHQIEMANAKIAKRDKIAEVDAVRGFEKQRVDKSHEVTIKSPFAQKLSQYANKGRDKEAITELHNFTENFFNYKKGLSMSLLLSKFPKKYREPVKEAVTSYVNARTQDKYNPQYHIQNIEQKVAEVDRQAKQVSDEKNRERARRSYENKKEAQKAEPKPVQGSAQDLLNIMSKVQDDESKSKPEANPVKELSGATKAKNTRTALNEAKQKGKEEEVKAVHSAGKTLAKEIRGKHLAKNDPIHYFLHHEELEKKYGERAATLSGKNASFVTVEDGKNVRKPYRGEYFQTGNHREPLVPSIVNWVNDGPVKVARAVNFPGEKALQNLVESGRYTKEEVSKAKAEYEKYKKQAVEEDAKAQAETTERKNIERAENAVRYKKKKSDGLITYDGEITFKYTGSLVESSKVDMDVKIPDGKIDSWGDKVNLKDADKEDIADYLSDNYNIDTVPDNIKVTKDDEVHVENGYRSFYPLTNSNNDPAFKNRGESVEINSIKINKNVFDLLSEEDQKRFLADGNKVIGDGKGAETDGKEGETDDVRNTGTGPQESGRKSEEAKSREKKEGKDRHEEAVGSNIYSFGYRFKNQQKKTLDRAVLSGLPRKINTAFRNTLKKLGIKYVITNDEHTNDNLPVNGMYEQSTGICRLFGRWVEAIISKDIGEIDAAFSYPTGIHEGVHGILSALKVSDNELGTNNISDIIDKFAVLINKENGDSSYSDTLKSLEKSMKGEEFSSAIDYGENENQESHTYKDMLALTKRIEKIIETKASIEDFPKEINDALYTPGDNSQIVEHILVKAASDENFKEKLLGHPRVWHELIVAHVMNELGERRVDVYNAYADGYEKIHGEQEESKFDPILTLDNNEILAKFKKEIATNLSKEDIKEIDENNNSILSDGIKAERLEIINSMVTKQVEETYAKWREQGKEQADSKPLNQIAWHGSNTRFDKFDLDHIGNGEGAQVHGWGLYFAKNRETSQGIYLDRISNEKDKKTLYAVDIPENEKMLDEDSLLKNQPKVVQTAIHKIDEIFKNAFKPVFEYTQKREFKEVTYDDIARNRELKERLKDLKGEIEYWKNLDKHLYENSSTVEYHFLDLFGKYDIADKLSIKPWAVEAIREGKNKGLVNDIVQKLKEELKNEIRMVKNERQQQLDNIGTWENYKRDYLNVDGYEYYNNMTGYLNEASRMDIDGKEKVLETLNKMGYSDIAKQISWRERPDRIMSEMLRKFGVQGIRYDGEEDGECYVVFNDKAIRILKKYDATDKKNLAQQKVEDIVSQIKQLFPNAKKIESFGPLVFVETQNGNKINFDIEDIIEGKGSEAERIKAENGIPADMPITINGQERVINGEAFIMVSRDGEIGTAAHEVVHLAMDAYLTDKENQTLIDAYKGQAQKEGRAVEEVIADAGRDLFLNKKSNPECKGILRKLWHYITHNLRQIFDKSYRAKTILESVTRGEPFDRQRRADDTPTRYSVKGIIKKHLDRMHEVSHEETAQRAALYAAGVLPGKERMSILQRQFEDPLHIFKKYFPDGMPIYRLADGARRKMEKFVGDYSQKFLDVFKGLDEDERKVFDSLVLKANEMHRDPMQVINLDDGIHLAVRHDAFIEHYDSTPEAIKKIQELRNSGKYRLSKMIQESEENENAGFGKGFTVFALPKGSAAFKSEAAAQEYAKAHEKEAYVSMIRSLSDKPMKSSQVDNVMSSFMKYRDMMDKVYETSAQAAKESGANYKLPKKLNGYFPQIHLPYVVWVKDKDTNTFVRTSSFYNASEASKRAKELTQAGQEAYWAEINPINAMAHGDRLAKVDRMTEDQLKQLNDEGLISVSESNNDTGNYNEALKRVFNPLFKEHHTVAIKDVMSHIEKVSRYKRNTGSAVHDNYVKRLQSQIRVTGLYKKLQKMKKDDVISQDELNNIINSANMKQQFNPFFQKRSGASGYSQNVADSVYRYLITSGNFISKAKFYAEATAYYTSKYHKDIREEATTNEQKFLKTYIEANHRPASVTALDRMINDYMNLLAEKDPTGIGSLLRRRYGQNLYTGLAKDTLSLQNLLKLGLFRPASLAVQAFQVLNSNAKLGGNKYIGMSKYFRTGLKEATGSKYDEKWKELYDYVGINGKSVAIDSEILGRPTGVFDKKILFGKSAKDLADKSMWFFNVGDKWARKATAIGGYLKAMDDFKALTHDEKKMMLNEAITSWQTKKERARQNHYPFKDPKPTMASVRKEYVFNKAKDLVTETNFNYSVTDSPLAMTEAGVTGKLLLQFKKYPLFTLNFMLHNTKEENIRFLVPMFIMAGALGMPCANLVDDIFDKTTGHSPVMALKKGMINWAGGSSAKRALVNVALYGAPSMAGINLSSNIGLGDAIQFDLGPTVSTVSNIAKGNGILRSLAPRLGYIEEAMTGKKENKYGQITAKYTPYDQLLKVFGFRTMAETNSSDATRVMKLATQKYNECKSQAKKEYIKNPDTDNYEALKIYGMSDGDIAKLLKTKDTTAMETAIKTVPKKAKSPEAQEVRNLSKTAQEFVK